MWKVLFLIMFIVGYSPLSAQRMPDLIPYSNGALWGYSDTLGIVVITPQWKSGGFFKDKKAVVGFFANGRSYYALINKDGHYIIPPEYHWNGIGASLKYSALNVSDDSGQYGYVDNNGNLSIPISYIANSEARFQYQKDWGTYFLEVSKNGKYGIIDTLNSALIPFDYDELRYELKDIQSNVYGNSSLSLMPFKEPALPALMKLIVARKYKLWGLINSHNQVVIPFGKYDALHLNSPCWITCWTGLKTGICDTSGRIIIPAKYTSIEPAGSHYFIASKINHNKTVYGLLNEKNKTVLPFRYSEIRAKQDQIVIALGDSTARVNNSKSITGFHRYLDNKTLEPITDWQVGTILSEGEFSHCGTGEATFREFERRDRLRPSIRIDSTLVKDFVLDTMSWSTVATTGTGIYSLQGYRKNNYNDGIYTAVINEQLQYLIKPDKRNGQLLHFNAQDELAVSATINPKNGQSFYTLLNKNMQPVLPEQRNPIAIGFRWKRKLYALSGSKRLQRDYDADPMSHQMNYPTLIDSSGQQIEALAPFHIMYMAHEDGTPAKQFEGYFFAKDNLDRYGVISIDGSVQFPNISFKNGDTSRSAQQRNLIEPDAYTSPTGLSTFIPIGNGWFLHNQHLVNGNGKELFSGLSVVKVEPAYDLINPEGTWPPSQKRIPGVYILHYMKDGKVQHCYLTTNGRAHTANFRAGH